MKTYTFNVSLADEEGVWRQLELPADFTLEALHLAIQEAYAFDNDHLYSFFMSGEAWDTTTEYALPEDANSQAAYLEAFDDEVAEDDDDEEDDDTEDAEDQDADILIVDENGEPLPDPTPAQISEMFQTLKDNPELMAEAKKQVTEQLGIPGFLFDMVVNNADQVVNMIGDPAAFANTPITDVVFDLTPPAGDVRDTTLDMLELKQGQGFLYLFDYGDEWRFDVRVAAVNDAADPGAAYPRLVESVGAAPEQYEDWEDDDELEDEIADD